MADMNGFNQSGFGGPPPSSGGDGSMTANGLSTMPQQRRRRYSTAQPPAPQGGSQPQPTFAQMQQNGQARPAPPPQSPEGVSMYSGGMQNAQAPAQQGGSVGGDLQNRVQQALNAPSRYDLDSVKQVRDALQQDLQTKFDAQGKALNDEMAKRGLSESTIAGQRYSDLGSEQAHALADINAQLLQNYAATQAQDLSASLGAGQNYENSLQSNDLARTLGLGNLDLNRQQLAQSGSQFDRSLAQSGNQFNLQQQLAEKLGLGNLDLQKQSLAQSGSQFDKSYALQQAAQDLDRQVKTGQLSLAEAQQKLAELSQQQNYALGQGSQDLQKKQLEQSGNLGNLNLMLQYLNSVGATSQPELAAQIAKLLGLQSIKTGGGSTGGSGGGNGGPGGGDTVITGNGRTVTGGTGGRYTL